MQLRGIYFVLWIGSLLACKGDDRQEEQKTYTWLPMQVTATAYNSVKYQTSDDPMITAWGDTLRPNVKWIAVSRDLINAGLRHNTMVKIDTFEGIYIVKDKMNKRWRKRIDIFMGADVAKAKKWGRRKVKIQYAVPQDTANAEKP